MARLKIIENLLKKTRLFVLFYQDPDRSDIIKLVIKTQKETDMLLTNIEAYQIFMAVKRTKKIKGDIAEVGVYKGGSARLICAAKGDKHLHLFDTFDGLPETSRFDVLLGKGEYSSSFENVKKYLKKYSNVYFYKGLFPATAGKIKNKKFSFVNLDVDIYKSTLDCLKFFYPRMNKGGVILSHDYNSKWINGVREAIDEFFEDKPEPIIELAGSQCLIVKI